MDTDNLALKPLNLEIVKPVPHYHVQRSYLEEEPRTFLNLESTTSQFVDHPHLDYPYHHQHQQWIKVNYEHSFDYSGGNASHCNQQSFQTVATEYYRTNGDFQEVSNDGEAPVAEECGWKSRALQIERGT